MNRRGAVIAIYLTVVVAILLSGIAIFNFLNHGDVFGSITQDNEKVIEQSLVMKYYIEGTAKIIMLESANDKFTKEEIQRIADLNDLRIAGQGNFFSKIAEGDFEIREENGNHILLVKDVLIFSQSGKTSIKRIFDLEIEAESNGEFIRFINN